MLKSLAKKYIGFNIRAYPQIRQIRQIAIMEEEQKEKVVQCLSTKVTSPERKTTIIRKLRQRPGPNLERITTSIIQSMFSKILGSRERNAIVEPITGVWREKLLTVGTQSKEIKELADVLENTLLLGREEELGKGAQRNILIKGPGKVKGERLK